MVVTFARRKRQVRLTWPTLSACEISPASDYFQEHACPLGESHCFYAVFLRILPNFNGSSIMFYRSSIITSQIKPIHRCTSLSIETSEFNYWLTLLTRADGSYWPTPIKRLPSGVNTGRMRTICFNCNKLGVVFSTYATYMILALRKTRATIFDNSPFEEISRQLYISELL